MLVFLVAFLSIGRSTIASLNCGSQDLPWWPLWFSLPWIFALSPILVGVVTPRNSVQVDQCIRVVRRDNNGTIHILFLPWCRRTGEIRRRGPGRETPCFPWLDLHIGGASELSQLNSYRTQEEKIDDFTGCFHYLNQQRSSSTSSYQKMRDSSCTISWH